MRVLLQTSGGRQAAIYILTGEVDIIYLVYFLLTPFGEFLRMRGSWIIAGIAVFFPLESS
jgi:hypothetical protein